MDRGICRWRRVPPMPCKSPADPSTFPFCVPERSGVFHDDGLVVRSWNTFEVSGGRAVGSETTRAEVFGASPREQAPLMEAIPFQVARDLGAPLQLVLAPSLPPRPMPRKSLLDEFFSAGFSIIEDLFAPDFRKAPTPDPGPTPRLALCT